MNQLKYKEAIKEFMNFSLWNKMKGEEAQKEAEKAEKEDSGMLDPEIGIELR